MSDTIRYQYDANYASLDDIQGATNDAQALRDEVNNVFNVLATVYEGQAAAALQQRHIEISGVMDSVLLEISASRSAGADQQEATRALDAHLAGGF